MSETFLPEIKQETAIVAKNTGRATPQFLRFFNVDFRGAIKRLLDGLTTTQTQQAENLALINQALQLAGLALETADGAAGGSVRSGSDDGTVTLQSSFLPIAQVDLLTVSAGNLTMPGTAPVAVVSSNMTGGSFLSGQYRIIEIDNGVDGDTVFSGTFTVQNTGSMMVQNLIVSDTSSPQPGTVTLSRTTTGDISYRAEIRNLTPGVSVTNMGFYLFARRS